jgi:hypothetical protein
MLMQLDPLHEKLAAFERHGNDPLLSALPGFHGNEKIIEVEIFPAKMQGLVDSDPGIENRRGDGLRPLQRPTCRPDPDKSGNLFGGERLNHDIRLLEFGQAVSLRGVAFFVAPVQVRIHGSQVRVHGNHFVILQEISDAFLEGWNGLGGRRFQAAPVERLE